MGLIKYWSFDLGRFELGEEAADLLDVDFNPPSYDFLEESQATSSTWWIAVFARTAGRTVYGLRLVPSLALRRCPVVRCAEGESEVSTFSPTPAAFVRFLILESISFGDGWTKAQRLSAHSWRDIEALDKALGGSGDLSDVRQLVADDTLRLACFGNARAETRASLARRLLPDRFVSSWWTARLNASRKAVTQPAAAGPWREGLTALALATRLAVSTDDLPSIAARMVRQCPGLDGAWPAGGAFDARGSAAAVALAQAAARHAALPPEDPWAAAAAASLQDGYDGEAHLTLAEPLIRAGDFVGAWTALQAAAWWGSKRGRPAPQEALDLALSLARARSWKPLLEPLERMQELRPAGLDRGARADVVRRIARAMSGQ